MCPILARDSFTPYFPFTKKGEESKSLVRLVPTNTNQRPLRNLARDEFPDRRKEREDRASRSHPPLRAIENVKDYRVVVEPILQERGINARIEFSGDKLHFVFEKCVDMLVGKKFGAFVFFFFCKFCKQHFLVRKIGLNVELFQKNVKDEEEFSTFLLLLDSVINKYSSF